MARAGPAAEILEWYLLIMYVLEGWLTESGRVRCSRATSAWKLITCIWRGRTSAHLTFAELNHQLVNKVNKSRSISPTLNLLLKGTLSADPPWTSQVLSGRWQTAVIRSQRQSELSIPCSFKFSSVNLCEEISTTKATISTLLSSNLLKFEKLGWFLNLQKFWFRAKVLQHWLCWAIYTVVQVISICIQVILYDADGKGIPWESLSFSSILNSPDRVKHPNYAMSVMSLKLLVLTLLPLC